MDKTARRGEGRPVGEEMGKRAGIGEGRPVGEAMDRTAGIGEGRPLGEEMGKAAGGGEGRPVGEEMGKTAREDIETKAKRSFDPSKFSISKRSKLPYSKNFKIEEERTGINKKNSGTKRKRTSLFLKF